MKPTIAETARAYLLPAVATVCSAQVAMLLAMLLLDLHERAFQGPTFRWGMVAAILLSIVSVRRRAGRAFYAARRNNTVRMRRSSGGDLRQAEDSAGVFSVEGVRRLTERSSTTAARQASAMSAQRYYFCVDPSCPERALVVLYLQFRRIPFTIESGDRDFATRAARHA